MFRGRNTRANTRHHPTGGVRVIRTAAFTSRSARCPLIIDEHDDLGDEADHGVVLVVRELEVIEDARGQPPGADDLAANVSTLGAGAPTNSAMPAPACIRDRVAGHAELIEVTHEQRLEGLLGDDRDHYAGRAIHHDSRLASSR